VLGNVTRKINDVQRVRQIIQIVIKYGFGYLVARLNIGQNIIGRRLIKLVSAGKHVTFDTSISSRTRRMLEELGPTFIKLGQILSTRPDLIPLEFCREFGKLQNEADEFEYDKVEKQIYESFKKPVKELFSDFSAKPFAAASLSQVHSAQLSTGEKVVVKVQRPGIKKKISADLDILYILAKLAEKHIPESRLYNPTKIVDEFRKAVLREIDFTIEANNIDRFCRNFKDDHTVHIPRVIHHLSTKKILTMEKIEGIKITSIGDLEDKEYNRKQIAVNMVNAVLKQIFVDGFFHGDPHPGNILIMADNTVAFLDFGMVGYIDDEVKDLISAIFMAVINRDSSGITEVFTSMGALEEETDGRMLRIDIAGLIDKYYGVSLREIKAVQFLPEIGEIISRNRVKVPSVFFLLSKALITVEGVSRELYPDFNVLVQAKPFAQNLLKNQYSPKKIAREIKKLSKSLYKFLSSLPKDMNLILGKVKKGKLRIEFEHKGLENLIFQMDKVSNRIAFSVVIAALIVGSSIIMQAGRGTLFLGLPMLGMIGFLVAAIMGLWLAIAILRSGKL